MADVKKSMILEIDLETGSVTKGLDTINDSLDKTGSKASSVGKKGGKGMQALSKGLKLGKTGFMALGKAIAATGIGAIVMVIALLVQKLMSMKPVMDAIEKATAFVGGAFKILADVAITMGEWLYWAFNSPQEALDQVNQKLNDFWMWLKSLGTVISTSFQIAMKQLNIKFKEAAIATKEFFGLDASELKAEIKSIEGEIDELNKVLLNAAEEVVAPFDAMADAIVATVTKMVDAGVAAVKLQEKFMALRVSQRALNLESAKATKEIAQMKKDSDDLSLSIEERVAAAKAAGALEEDLRAKKQALITRELSLLMQEQKLQGENEERTEAMNELRIQEHAIIEAGLAIQTEVMTKTQGLLAEQEDARKAFFQAQRARKDEEKGEQEQELLELAEYYALQIEIAEQYGFDTKTLLEAQQTELAALKAEHLAEDVQAEKDANKKKRDDAKALQDAKFKFVSSSLGAIMALNTAFSSQDEADAERSFKRNKALAMSTAIVNTGLAVVGALTAGGNPLKLATGAQFVEAGLAAAAGAAQIATIAKTQFSSSDTEIADVEQPPGIAPGAGGGGGGDSSSPELDLSFLGAGASGNVQAFVISNEVTNSQQSDQLISDQASLV